MDSHLHRFAIKKRNRVSVNGKSLLQDAGHRRANSVDDASLLKTVIAEQSEAIS